MPYITSTDIERVVGFRIKDAIKDRIDLTYPLKYSELRTAEGNMFAVGDDYIFRTQCKEEIDKPLKVAGEHRHDDWEKGWAENREEFKQTKNVDSLIPKYHTRGSSFARFDGRVVIPQSPLFDYRLNSFIVDSVLVNLISLKNFVKIAEFGCGTGHHLLRLKKYFSEYFSDLQWHGLDWATSSQDILNGLEKEWYQKPVVGLNFNFFHPDYKISFKDGLVYTVAALEQIGNKHEELIQYWLQDKPNLIVHFEPIKEVLNRGNELDRLSLDYMDKRGYLDGYLTRLRELEVEGKLKIEHVRRFNCGSQFLEGHTCIIWRPL